MKPNKVLGTVAVVLLIVVAIGNIYLLTMTNTFREKFDMIAIPEQNYVLDSGEIVDYQNTDNVRMLVTDGQVNIELESGETGKIVDTTEDGFIIQLDTTTAEHHNDQVVYRGNEVLGHTSKILDGRRIECKVYEDVLYAEEDYTNEQ